MDHNASVVLLKSFITDALCLLRKLIQPDLLLRTDNLSALGHQCFIVTHRFQRVKLAQAYRASHSGPLKTQIHPGDTCSAHTQTGHLTFYVNLKEVPLRV